MEILPLNSDLLYFWLLHFNIIENVSTFIFYFQSLTPIYNDSCGIIKIFSNSVTNINILYTATKVQSWIKGDLT